MTGSVAHSCNPAAGRSDFGLACGKEVRLHLAHVDLASALSLASTWATGRSASGSGCLMRGESGQRGDPAAKSPRVSQ